VVASAAWLGASHSFCSQEIDIATTTADVGYTAIIPAALVNVTYH